MGNLKDGLALWLETKLAPGRRDRGVVYVKVFDWLSWFPCMWTACDHHRLLLQWRHMTVWPLMWLVQLWHITIWPLTWLVQPSQNPLACLYKPRVCGNKAELLRWNPCRVLLSLARRGGWVGGPQAHLSSGPLGFAEGSSTASLFLWSAPLFPPDTCPGVGLLVHVVAIFLVL